MATKQSYIGHARRRSTSRFVHFSDVASRLLITVGGISTIVAVTLVCVFLVWVAYPLFLGASVKERNSFPLSANASKPLRTGVDEYQEMAWTLFSDGTLDVYRLDNGHILERRQLFPGAKLTACSVPSREEKVAFGFADGVVRMGRISFVSRYLEAKNTPAALKDLPDGEVAEFDHGLARRMGESQLRALKVNVELEEPIKPTDAAAVQLIDLSIRPTGPVVSLLTSDGKLRTSSVSSRENLITGETTKELVGGELDVSARSTKEAPRYLLLSGAGDNVYLVWADGHLMRVSTQELENPSIVEEMDLVEKGGATLTALQFQIGKSTLLAGDSSGRVRAWFRVKPDGAKTADGAVLVAAHEFPGAGSAVTALATSAGTRIMAVGYADGRVRINYVTSEKPLGEVSTHEPGQPILELALAPKDDGLIALISTGVHCWTMDPRFPEVTLKSLFLPVWYEGYTAPTHVWQSSSGSDEFEPKFGLWPLVFGTLKATFYSLLLGVPLALMAAVYTSEFLHPSTRAAIKPTIELMASLPSVVLGFLSALVLAPFVEDALPAVLASLVTIPGAFLLAAYAWQLLPDKLSLLLSHWRFCFICAVLPIGIGSATIVGPAIESVFFRGDFKGWLAGQSGGSTSGWMFILLPFCALVVVYLLGQYVNPRLRQPMARLSRPVSALADFGKFVAAVAAAFGMALAIGALLSGLGFDPRGTFVGTFVQRNALVVGFMMGFAIIPIIYTISEDALSAVPEHLRSASLGCGATQWQTARRIIIPTAMSGLFSAVMIGLGRAVGETMIVLMAAGNTPVMEMNIFNGFRTLSANIAVELPEAVRNSTHYRTLFLAALVLFGMTFVVNTAAELVRSRFRKRAYQL